MATLQEVLRHMTGHNNGQPNAITWRANFTRVNQPPHGTSDAFTHADFPSSYSFSSRADANGKHRLRNVRVRVGMNRNLSWYVAGRDTPLLLRHEQGHYNISFLVGRELCWQLLDLEWDHSVLDAVGEGRPNQIVARLRSDAARLGADAQAASTSLNLLYDDPNRGAKNADGSINPQAQARWDGMIQHAIQTGTSLQVLVQMTGGNPRTW